MNKFYYYDDVLIKNTVLVESKRIHILFPLIFSKVDLDDEYYDFEQLISKINTNETMQKIL